MDLDRNLVAAALPGYVVGDEIGRGGWGSVFQAQHVALGRNVAVKQLPRAFANDPSALARFISEARIIGQLDHPHIMKVYDFVEHDGTWLIVMELLSGGTLWEYFSAYGTRADQACGIGLAMCSALEAAHDHGILHRDIKPENILFSSEGVARLGDFGIAMEVDLDVRRTRAGEVIGTPTYMSPEQAWGHDLGPPSDVYSLGIVLYEQLAGRVPFPEAKTPVESLIQHARDTPAPLSETAPDVPAPIVAVVMQALEKAVQDRYATARDFGVALAEASGESFGPNWLHNSGTKLMGGGVIGAAALRPPPREAAVRHPTMAHPALRADHFVGGDLAAADDDGRTSTSAPVHDPTPGLTPGPGADPAPAPMPADVPEPSTRPVSQPVPPATMFEIASAPTTPYPGVPLVDGRPPGAPPAPPPAGPPPGASPGPPGPPGHSGHPQPVPGAGGPTAAPARRSGRRALTAVIIVLVLVAAGTGTALVLTRGSSSTLAASSQPAGTVAPPTVSSAAPSTVAPTTTTTAPARTCKPEGSRCIFIDDVKLVGDKYKITWTALGFDPSFKEGFFHAHFFWDIYSPDQAGTNAKTFNVEQGVWEITDVSPYTGTAEMTVAKKPAPANRICVTVGNFAHAVADPTQFDCVPIPK